MLVSQIQQHVKWIIHHNQAGVTPVIQSRFTMKINQIMYRINRCRKIFDKIQYLLIGKTTN